MRFTTCPVPECGAKLHAHLMSHVDNVTINEELQMLTYSPGGLTPTAVVYCSAGHGEEQIRLAIEILYSDAGHVSFDCHGRVRRA